MLEKMETIDIDQVIEEFETITKDAEKIQRETLKKILEENGSAEYLQNLGLNGRTDPESYKACVPLVSHTDLEPYIRRIADGDPSHILTGKAITTISLSSGTTQGKPKFVPFNEELMETTMQIFRTSFAFRNKYFFKILLIFLFSMVLQKCFGCLLEMDCALMNHINFGEFPIGNGKALQFIYSSRQFITKGGLSAGTATTNVYRNAQFKSGMKAMQSQCCSPDEVIFGSDYQQSLYCHLLCGLIFCEEIQLVFSTFAHSIVHAFRTFEVVWEELCADIREGVLSSRITVPSIRAAMSKILKPNPELADLIHKRCSGLSNWYGLIPTLFPSAKYVYGILTGSMEPYLQKLRHYAGDLHLMSADYGSSEGWIGANVNPSLPPESATYAVLPNIGYFEFLPQNVEDRVLCLEPKPVGLTEVKVGEEYEIIVTNFAGLYRYRLGDVVKVMGFHNSTPELKFVCRSNLLLTINIDKNTEKDLQLSVETAAKLLAEEKLEVLDFTSHVDVSTDPGHYVIFWEISGDASDEVLKECCNCLDRSFVDAGYVSSRKVNGIGPLELRIVHKGTFQKILDHYVALGSALNQFKTPRCVGTINNAVLQILADNVAKNYFSTAFG
ncbi:hypothetical protein Patl1_00570 [Pistacia atlantica]|uniref:Uncharacterized protein n=1 Tax=Pistacia atlantica TaxID=434234 RepID=A0ACC1CA34_9ROSI|nr:hypothetical protein Patl1_00570 [Pistacia atlantica]